MAMQKPEDIGASAFGGAGRTGPDVPAMGKVMIPFAVSRSFAARLSGFSKGASPRHASRKCGTSGGPFINCRVYSPRIRQNHR